MRLANGRNDVDAMWVVILLMFCRRKHLLLTRAGIAAVASAICGVENRLKPSKGELSVH